MRIIETDAKNSLGIFNGAFVQTEEANSTHEGRIVEWLWEAEWKLSEERWLWTKVFAPICALWDSQKKRARARKYVFKNE